MRRTSTTCAAPRAKTASRRKTRCSIRSSTIITPMGRRLPMARAEKLKVEEGSAILGNCLPGETVVLQDDSGFAGKEIERETLNTIIHVRMRELLEVLKRRLQQQTYLDFLGAGIFI